MSRETSAMDYLYWDNPIVLQLYPKLFDPVNGAEAFGSPVMQPICRKLQPTREQAATVHDVIGVVEVCVFEIWDKGQTLPLAGYKVVDNLGGTWFIKSVRSAVWELDRVCICVKYL